LVVGFIGTLKIVTTINSSAVTKLHTLQFTTVRTNSSQSAVSSLRCWVTSSNSGCFSALGLTPSQTGVCLATRLGVATQRLTTVELFRLPSLRQATLSTSVCLRLPASELDFHSTLDLAGLSLWAS
jgi:hypothetical protein